MSDLRKLLKNWVASVKVEWAEGMRARPSDEALVALLEKVVEDRDTGTGLAPMELRQIQALAAKAAAEKEGDGFCPKHGLTLLGGCDDCNREEMAKAVCPTCEAPTGINDALADGTHEDPTECSAMLNNQSYRDEEITKLEFDPADYPIPQDAVRPKFNAKMEETWAALSSLAYPMKGQDPAEGPPVVRDLKLVTEKEDRPFSRKPEPEFRLTFTNGTVLWGQLRHLSGHRFPKGGN